MTNSEIDSVLLSTAAVVKAETAYELSDMASFGSLNCPALERIVRLYAPASKAYGKVLWLCCGYLRPV